AEGREEGGEEKGSLGRHGGRLILRRAFLRLTARRKDGRGLGLVMVAILMGQEWVAWGGRCPRRRFANVPSIQSLDAVLGARGVSGEIMASRPATTADSCWTQENVASLGNASRRRADTLFQSHQAKIDVMLCLAVVLL